jgi:hypothetical protein
VVSFSLVANLQDRYFTISVPAALDTVNHMLGLSFSSEGAPSIEGRELDNGWSLLVIATR